MLLWAQQVSFILVHFSPDRSCDLRLAMKPFFLKIHRDVYVYLCKTIIPTFIKIVLCCVHFTTMNSFWLVRSLKMLLFYCVLLTQILRNSKVFVICQQTGLMVTTGHQFH